MRTNGYFWAIIGVFLSACSAQDVTPGSKPAGTFGTPAPATPTAPGAPAQAGDPPQVQQERGVIQEMLSKVEALGSAELLAQHKLPFQPAPSYERSSVAGLALIQASAHGLAPAELSVLANQGFVISGTRAFPSFLYAYASLYAADLPVYVSADSILYSIHDSYDAILAALERKILVVELQELLAGMRARLALLSPEAASSTTLADADVYLGVAESLLRGSVVAPRAGGDAQLISNLTGLANDARGEAKVELFGFKRLEDFSQFKPRGHYAGDAELERYFRGMMWLGRTDFRLLETQEDGTQLFHRRQVEAALLLRELIDAPLRERFDRIDSTVTAFVGEHDYMQLSQLDALQADLGGVSLAGLARVPDDQIVKAIRSAGYGAQRISSHIMINGMTKQATMPLSFSFALLGQRYVLDSHVLSNVVYDRAGKGKVKRLMPSPLDVAFAALGNDQAASLLAPELEEFAYAPDLASMRVLADAHPSSFWQGNLYNLWLSSLRELSPDAAMLSDANSGLFATARSELWGRRLLSTQLASWAELRHDTILYAKQSYTGGVSCEFPDAYVDPYPKFYSKVYQYATSGKDLVLGLGLPSTQTSTSIIAYFERLATVAERLREMAEHELTGAAFTPEMLAFINDAVTVDPGCGEASVSNLGWYGKLFFDNTGALLFDPTIADVHTQPTDLAGNPVGRVLHVGTGAPRLMAVVAEGCSGPRAYVGPVSAYYELITEDFERLNDAEWSKRLTSAPAQDPAWLAPLVTR